MTPTWYDLLGVEPDATPEQIRAAWRSAIADLDPGERRFRALNEAAEVLLDPARREAYDRALGVAQEPEPGPEPGPVTLEKPAPADTEAVEAGPVASAAGGRRRLVPAWLLSGLAVLTALAVAAAAYLYTQPSDQEIAEASSQAQGAAERAVTTILAYDYRHLEDDQRAAGELMTSDYRKDYDALFTQIAANAPSLKVVVTVEVVASGLVRVGEDRAQVLVFVNRPTLRKDDTEPQIYRDQVVLTMVEADGEWLVDGMDTNQLAD